MSVLSVAGCSKQGDPTFPQEQAAITKALPSEARLVSSAKARRIGETIETSWICEIITSPGVAKATFQERIPPDYKLIRTGDQEFTYTKYDGHDEFDLTVTFAEGANQKTAMNVVLRSIPD